MELTLNIYDKTGRNIIVAGAYDEITGVLSAVFPDITPDEWKCIKVKELMPVIIDIAKSAVSETFVIPKNPKN